MGRFLEQTALAIVLAGLIFGNSCQASATVDPNKQLLGIYYVKIADKLYQKQELPGNLELSLEYFKKALSQSDSISDVGWKISRCYWGLATKTTNNLKKMTYHKEGIKYGTMAVDTSPDNSNAHAWLSLNLGSSALNQGVVKSLYKKDLIKSGLETAIRLNPKNIVAITGLATWYHHVPTLLGGDPQKALRLIDEVIALQPDYTMPHILKAEFLISAQRFSEATVVLKSLIDLDQPDDRWEGTENKFKAKELLKQLKSRESG